MFLSTAGCFALFCFINNIMLCIIDVGVVINGPGEEGVGHSPFIGKLDNSHVGHVLAVAPCSHSQFCQ